MGNCSLDEWGTPVIDGVISVYGDMGVDNILGGKTILFNLNLQWVLCEIVYGYHPALVTSVVRGITESARIVDVRVVEAYAEVLEEVSLIEADIVLHASLIKMEATHLVEMISREVHISIPAEYIIMGDTIVRGIVSGISEILTIVESRTIGGITSIKTETSSLGETISSSPTRLLGEAISMIQLYKMDVVKNFSEMSTLLDVRSSHILKSYLGEGIAIVDAYSNLVSIIKVEVSAVADLVSHIDVVRYLIETPVMLDGVSRRFHRYASEVFVLVDSRKLTFWVAEVVSMVDKISVDMRRMFTEIFSTVDAYYHTKFLYEVSAIGDDLRVFFWKNVNEVVSLADSYKPMFTRAEIISLVDTYWRTAVHYIPDAFGIRDRTVRARPLHYISDRVCATDLSIKYYITRPLAELIAGVDVMLKHITTPRLEKTTILLSQGRTTATRYLNDSVSAVDNLLGRSFAILTEKIYAADTFSRNAISNIREHFHIKDLKYKHPLVYADEILSVIESRISHPILSKIENVIHTDTRISHPFRTLLDSTRVLDRKYKHAQVYVINIIAFYESKFISYTRVLSEAFPLIESRYAMANRYIIDSFKLSDSKIKHPLVYAHEAIIPLENRAMAFYKSEIIPLGDSITREFARHLSDLVSTRDRIKKNVRSIRSELGILGDVISRGNISRILTESAQMIDTKRYEISRYLRETIKHIGIVNSRSMKYLSLEMTSIKESRIAHPSKMLTETMTGIETYLRHVSAFHLERLRSIDVRKSTVVFVVSDLLRISDKTVPYIRKMLSETVLGLDVRAQAVTKFFTDSVRAVQRYVKQPTLVKTEQTNLSDVGVRNLERVLTDALNVGDSLLRTLSTVVTEALHVVDRKRKEYTSTLIEHFHMGDTIRSFKSLFRRHGSNATQTSRVSLINQTTKTTDVKQETTQKEIDEDAD